ncbi:MAG: polymer-forming cytoskeletal protein [Syntrophomonadaceae bacterium]|nr:polymer-forming cytoskeletal protein [Syntrophomonadaceae bacterium]
MRKKAREYANIESVISETVEVKGDITSQSSLRLDGKVEGRLQIKGDLIVGEKGYIKGEVRVTNLMLAGKIEGNAAAIGRLEITATGKMYGDVTCNLLTIEEGGQLDGTSKMLRDKEKPELEKARISKKN